LNGGRIALAVASGIALVFLSLVCFLLLVIALVGGWDPAFAHVIPPWIAVIAAVAVAAAAKCAHLGLQISRSAQAFAQHPWRWLVAILCFVLCVGIVIGIEQGDWQDNMAIWVMAGFPLYILIYAWMRSDAAALQVRPPPGAIPLIPLSFPLAVLYYLLGTRRKWHKLGSLALLACYVCLASVIAGVGAVAPQSVRGFDYHWSKPSGMKRLARDAESRDLRQATARPAFERGRSTWH
jgi:hypothetical protein